MYRKVQDPSLGLRLYANAAITIHDPQYNIIVIFDNLILMM